MKIKFNYNNSSVIIDPIEVRFFQKENEAGQMYLVCEKTIVKPVSIEIENLFKGDFVFEEINEFKVMYFVNSFVFQESNHILYYDTYKNKIIDQLNHIIVVKNVKSIDVYRKHLSYSNIEINSESLYSFGQMKYNADLSAEEEVILRSKTQDRIHITFDCVAKYNGDGILKKVIVLKKFDEELIKQHIRTLLSNKTIEITTFKVDLHIKVGNLIKMYDQVFTVTSIEHYITSSVNQTFIIAKNIPKNIFIKYENTKSIGGESYVVRKEDVVEVVVNPLIELKMFNIYVENYV